MTPSGPVSPLLAGRDDELAVLADDFADVAALVDGAVHTALVAGEAGLGKSRLVAEHLARVRVRAVVAQGECVDTGPVPFPFSPFVRIVGDLVAAISQDKVSDELEPWVRAELARLVPTIGVPASATDPDLARAQLFGAVHALVVAVARHHDRPVVVVVEDLHWADHATCDLLVFLAHQVVGRPVQVVATYRDTDLATAPALRRAVLGLSRRPGVRRLALARLSPTDVAAQLEGMLGRRPAPDLVDAVHRVGDGLPLHTEALVSSSGELRTVVSDDARHRLLHTLDDLPDTTRAALGALAVAGGRADHAHLAALSGLDDVALSDALRPAVATRVVTADASGYGFRHHLFATVVADDLLPGVRRALHARRADLLVDSRPRAPMALVAQHRAEAGQAEAAVVAAWTAATATAVDHALRLAMLELVLDHWDDAPGAVAATGADRVAVLQQAADSACWNGETDRGAGHVEAAVAALRAGDDRARLAAALLERASLRDQGLAAGEVADLAEAVRLAPAGSDLRAEACCQQARRHLALGLPVDVAVVRAAADDSGSDEYRLEADVVARHVAADADGLADVAVEARRLGLTRIDLIATSALAEVLAEAGRLRECADVALAGAERIDAAGLPRYAIQLSVTGCRALVDLGEWDAALDAVDRALAASPAPRRRLALLLARAEVEAGRGLLGAARATLGEAADLEPADEAGFEPAIARTHLLLGDPVAPARDGGPDRDRWELAALLGATSDAPVTEWTRTLALEAAAARGRRPDPARWEEVARAWQRLGSPHRAARALVAAAEAHAATGVRRAAQPLLAEASAVAERLAAAPLQAAIAPLARRVRLAADDGGPRLTDRERQVLRLVCLGRTNPQVADELVISRKTASVHVSHILAKLDVATRGEAAARARRLGLVD